MIAKQLARKPVALAAALVCLNAFAQPADNTSSADVPEAKTLFETGGQATIGPRPFTSFAERLTTSVNTIELKVARDNLPADGVTGVDVRVQLFDNKGLPISQDVEVTIETTGGARVLLPGRLTSESGADRGDIDRITPGVQTMVKAGVLDFKLIAPYQPEAVVLRVSVRGVAEKVTVRYVPDLRNMVAVGLLEGRLRSDRFNPNAIVPVRENDGFDNELRGFTREFNGGATRLGARAAVYLKGKVQGEYLLTMAYDSDKDTRRQLFQTIDPNAFYPVYGDSSIKGADAQSSGKLYVRIDKNRSFVLYGDYTTTDNNPARTLSQYSRSLSGLKGHYEEGKIIANGFVAQQTYRQVIDEFPARGVSGPYTVSNPNGVKGSEKVEIIVRSRYQSAIILKATTLAVTADYEFEPFSGQIVFRAPVPSLDDQLNPVSIRVTYEVDQGGQRFLAYGVDMRLKVSDALTLGGSIAKDENPAAPYSITGGNLLLKLSKSTEILAEVARSSSVVNTGASGFNSNTSANFAGKSGDVVGNAVRVEIRHTDESLRGRAFVARTDDNFNNSAGGLTGGRQEMGVSGTYKINKDLTVTAEGQSSKDRIAGSLNESASVAADLKITDRLTIGAGVRQVSQNSVSLLQQTDSRCLSGGLVSYNGQVSGYNTGYGISQSGNQQIDPATGLPVVCNTTINPSPVAPPTSLDRTSAFVRMGYKATDKLTVGAELQSVSGDDPTNLYKLTGRYAATDRLGFTGEWQREFSGNGQEQYKLGADWRVADKTRVYSRYEYGQRYGGAYGLGAGPVERGMAVGVDTQYMEGGSLYSEYRLRDGASGQTVQNALGLRNGWRVAEGLRLNTNVERLVSTSGSSSAAGIGAEYTANPLWKTSGRLEWRADNANTNWLLTLGIARKIDRDWTFLARDYLSLVQPKSVLTSDVRNNRLQFGFAYRPVDNNRFDALGLYERKTQDSGAGNVSGTDIVTLRGNYHPSRPWFLSGRFAFKRVNELLLGTVNDTYYASLLGGRVTYDITNRWSLGGITTVLVGKGGAKQYAYGVEVGYTVMDNLLVTMGYNWRGFTDTDLTGSNYTNQGWILGVRYKFDEDLFKSADPGANKTLTPGDAQPAAPAKP